MSKLFSLNWKDLSKAFVLALIALILNFAIEYVIPNLGISAENKILIIGIVSYLLKNFLTDSKDQFFGKGVKPQDIGGGGIKNPPKK